jgi:hypothetical protein
VPDFTYKLRADLYVSGASARLSRIIGAVAFAGDRLSFQPPTTQPNISYDLQAYTPLLRCNPANDTVQNRIVAMISNMTSGLQSPAPYAGQQGFFIDNETFHWYINMVDGENEASGDIGYFAAVPYYYDSRNETLDAAIPWWNSSQTGSLPTDNLPGQIWIAIATYPNNQTLMEFINCELYNVSLSFSVIFSNQVGSITNVDQQWINTVNPAYPFLEVSELSIVTNSYAAFFQDICSYLIGTVAWYNDTLDTHFQTAGQVLNTNLALVSQFHDMGQRIAAAANVSSQDSGSQGVRNISFSEEIEEFALNSSLSILNDPTLGYAKSHFAFDMKLSNKIKSSHSDTKSAQ